MTGMCPLKSKTRRLTPNGSRPTLTLFFALLIGFTLLTSCGDDDEEDQLPTAAPTAPTAVTAAAPSPDLQPPNVPLLPCHIDYAVAHRPSPAVEPTPEVIKIELLERPYRIVPSNIVLRQNRWYRFVITAGNQWHAFRVVNMGVRVEYEIPPGGEVDALVHTTNAGVFTIRNYRHTVFIYPKGTVTVIPEGAISSTWYPSVCHQLDIQAPPLHASLSTPFVIQGSIEALINTDLRVTRIVAWNNGKIVGQSTSEQFTTDGLRSDFLLTVSDLPPGAQALLLQAYLQNGTLVANATMYVEILPNPSDASPSGRYRGSIDLPSGEGLHSLPLTIRGWAIIPGSAQGTGVGSVEIWHGPRENGRFLTEATYGLYRPDVAQEFDDPRFAASGFVAQLFDLPDGPLELFAYIRDRQSGEYVSPPFLRAPISRRVSLAEGKVTDAAWPVALAAAQDGRLFFAELLTGNIRVLQDGQVLTRPFATLEDVSNHAESGLLGLALHPDFPQTPYVYAMYVVDDPATGFPTGQRVVRFRDVDNVGQDYTVILDNLPATKVVFHNGGRIAFGPDGKLYISIGDTDVPELAQDPTRLEGSIQRYNPDGSIPDDNPIPGSPVYATGLRNVFGLAFQPETGDLYATENGPGGFDEVNKIEPGRNYGWPIHMGMTVTEGFANPIAVFGLYPEPPIGPTGVTIVPDRPDLLLFCAYHGFALRALQLSGPDYTAVESTAVLSNNCALDITYTDDGWLYYTSVSAIYRARLDDLLRVHEQNAQ